MSRVARSAAAVAAVAGASCNYYYYSDVLLDNYSSLGYILYNNNNILLSFNLLSSRSRTYFILCLVNTQCMSHKILSSIYYIYITHTRANARVHITSIFYTHCGVPESSCTRAVYFKSVETLTAAVAQS